MPQQIAVSCQMSARVCFTAYAAGRTCRDHGYPVIAWLCWVPNLLVAQVLVRSARGRADF